jgi:hypothetical protein
MLPSVDDNFGERPAGPKPTEIFHVTDERRSTRTLVSAGMPPTFIILSCLVNKVDEGRMVFPAQRNGHAYPPGSRLNVAFIEPPTREDVETAHKAALLADFCGAEQPSPAVLAARKAVLALQKRHDGGDSNYSMGVKEACDEIGQALGMI